jgi:hypothetical protein
MESRCCRSDHPTFPSAQLLALRAPRLVHLTL